MFRSSKKIEWIFLYLSFMFQWLREYIKSLKQQFGSEPKVVWKQVIWTYRQIEPNIVFETKFGFSCRSLSK